MRTVAVTGAAGGMGSAIRKLLESNGVKVIGVDVRDAEVIADLSSAEGRAAMVAAVDELCGGKLEGVVAGAGVTDIKLSGEPTPGDLISSVNYFGAVATLDGLRPMLAKGDSPRAVAISSNTMTVVPVLQQLLDAYAANDEATARKLSNDQGGEGTPVVYASSKYGLAHWVRQQAIKPDWIGSGINLNVIAPGVIDTPMNPPGYMEKVLEMGEVYPVPAGRAGKADEIAGLVGFLLSEIAGYICGVVINIDGGTEAALRGEDSPPPRAIL